MLPDLKTIRQTIVENGYYNCEPKQSYGSYAVVIIKAGKRGYHLVSVCLPYGGNRHLCVPQGSGTWHFRGMDVQGARGMLPNRGSSLRKLVDEATNKYL